MKIAWGFPAQSSRFELIGVKLAPRRARVQRWLRVGHSAQMLVLMSIVARTSSWAAASTNVSL